MVLILSLLLPINVKAEKQIEYQPGWELTSPDNVLYREAPDVIEKLAQEYEIAQAKLKTKSTGYGVCACATYIESIYPQIKNIGQASNWPINTQFGAVGDVIVFTYNHVARIKETTATGYILDETNYIHCVHTTNRFIPFDDPTIKGYWSPAL